MPKKYKNPPWIISVGQKDKILAEISVPEHKMSKYDLKAFLRAVVIRYTTNSPQEMVGYYLNGKLGGPSRIPLADPRRVDDIDKSEFGFWVGSWDCYAYGVQNFSLSEERKQELQKWIKESQGV